MKKIYITTILVILIVIVVNMLSTMFHFRLDFTDDNQYTLSDATRDILRELEEPVTIKAYFTANVPPSIAKGRQDFQEMLVEYAAKSDGLVQYEFIDPATSETMENELLQKGIQPRMMTMREKDQAKQQKLFMAAVVSMGDKEEVLGYIPPAFPIEYGLSSAIKKISIDNKPGVGFLQGHGEPTLQEMGEVYTQLSVLYNPVPVTLSDTTGIPPDLKTLVVIRPRDSVSNNDFNKLEAFLAGGGHMLVALNRVDGNLQNAQGVPVSTGFEAWLANKGVIVEPNFIVDARCASVTVQQQTPFGMMQSQMAFPYLPIGAKFTDHPITKGLEGVVFQFVSQVTFAGDTSVRFTPLVFSSGQSNVLGAPLTFDIQKQWTEADLPMSDIAMAGAIEGRLAGSATSKMVIIGDGDFPVNGSGQQAQRLSPDNVNLLSNAIDWLTDDTGLIEMRTKGATYRPIDEMEEGTRAVLKYTNFLLPLMLVLIYGLVRFQRNRMRRLKRMSENYEED
ncbi:MAG TPA: GldG family protein [Cyclobacteriaceae bacterium]|nr:GldG family protein [Cyclobacteriaceae bacterium]